MSAAPLLDVRNLCVRYSLPVPVLDAIRGRRRQIDAVIDASFTLGAGETLAVVGESGSGKSSLGRALIGLERLSSGEVLFEGRNPFLERASGTPEFHRKAAMMFQDPVSSLSPRRTVGQLIAEPFAIHGLKKGEREAEVARLLGLVGLPRDMAARYPHQMSGGQARRVGVARAIALSPRLIVADEPTAGLDVSIQADVLNLMRALRDQFGISYVIITHNISLIRHISDRIAVTYLGRIVETGPTAEILSRPAHPYAAGLIAAQPRPDPEHRRTQAPLLGETPSLLNRPSGCEFRGRCPRAAPACAEAAPPLAPTGPERLSRCWFAEEELQSHIPAG